jgi:hypothetical protein
MFNRKSGSFPVFPVAIGTGLVVSGAVVVTVLVEAVSGRQCFL